MEEELRALILRRLSNSKETLGTAKLLLENNKFGGAINRSYYAMFYAARALLATKGLDSSKHSGVISLFNQHFVKTGKVDKSLGRLLMDAEDARIESDYEDFYVASEEEAEKIFGDAEKFVAEMEKALDKILEEENAETEENL